MDTMIKVTDVFCHAQTIKQQFNDLIQHTNGEFQEKAERRKKR